MKDGQPARWKAEHGYIEVAPGSGDLVTTRSFGDCQLHLEWAAPSPPRGEGQERGNSGVFLMEHYEVQILDSYRSRTYADGQAAAVYGQFPPLVNASRAPGEWQEYDIVFHRPRFDGVGKLVSPARMTVFHNRVLVQDDVELVGATAHGRRATYSVHPDRLPLLLQDHGKPVRLSEHLDARAAGAIETSSPALADPLPCVTPAQCGRLASVPTRPWPWTTA